MFSGWITHAFLILAVGQEPMPQAPIPAKGRAERSDALAQYALGVWQARHDRLLSAIKSFEAAAKQDPDATAPLKELVRLYAEIGREPDAIRTARQVLEKDPANLDTAHALAKLLHGAGEVKEALVACRLAAENPALDDRPDKALAIYRDLAVLCAANADGPGAETALRKAVTLLTTRRKAVFAARSLTEKEIDSETAEAWERLGKQLVKLRKFDAAASAFQSAYNLFYDPARANDPSAAAQLHWNLSGVEMVRGNPAAALPHLEAFLKLKPRSAEPYQRFAAALRQLGRGEEVSAALRAYADRNPKNLLLRAVLAAELARNPSTRDQADSLFAELSKTTVDPDVLRVVVHSHIETGRTGMLINELDQAYQAIKAGEETEASRKSLASEKTRYLAGLLRTEPEWANSVLRAAAEELRLGTKRTDETHHFMATLAAQHRKLELAAVQFRQAVRNAHPETESAAYEGLIDVLWRNHKPAEVAAVCRDGLRTSGSTAPVFFNYHLSLALARLGDADEALTVADKAISQAGDLNRLTVRQRKIQVLETLGRRDEAVAQCRKLLDEFDTPMDRLRIRYSLASAYWGAKKFAEAEAELRTILEIDPDHASANNDLGYHLADRGRNLGEAERLVRHAIALDRADRRKSGSPEPENPAYLDSLGWVLFRKGDGVAAREWLEKAATFPDGASDPVVWDHLGDVYFRLSDKIKAKSAWATALSLYDTDPRGKRDSQADELKKKLKLVP